MRQITKMKQKKENKSFTPYLIHLLEASKPPEGAGVVVAGSGIDGTIGTAAGTGGAGEVREPRASKPDSRRLFCTGAKAGTRAGAAVGARVGDIRPEGGDRHPCSCLA